MDSLWDHVLGARHGRLHCWTGQGFVTAGWDEVAADARAMAGGLRRLGVRPGVHVAAVLTNSPQAVRGVLAVWLAGGTVVSLPVPARGMSPDEYAGQIATLVELVGSPLLLTDGETAGTIPEKVRARVRATAWDSVGAGTVPARPPGDDEPAFVQFSSGSTDRPKGCVLTPRAIAAQLGMIREMTGAVPGRETVVSWLPLSHDMGMFGCLMFPWAFDMPLVLSTPQRFGFGPRSWFADLAEFGGTMTAGTNTALRLAARAQRGRPLARRLAVRTAIVGAERVEREALLAAVDAFGPSGLALRDLVPAYGMAEATLAVSATAPGAEPRFLPVDGIELADGKVVPADPDAPAASWLVGCGTPCPGVEVAAPPDGTVDELVLRSPSLADGYHGDPGLTRSRFTADGFRTGDLGFRHDGELFPVGRLDDVISVGGRNVNTREIELAVDGLAPIRPGCSAVLDVGRLVLVTELRKHGADLRAVAGAAGAVAMAKAGIALHECVFLSRGAVPKTPSGKIQRYRARQLLLAEELPTIATISLDSTA